MSFLRSLSSTTDWFSQIVVHKKKKEDERIETRKNISIIEHTQFRVVIKLKLNNKLLIMKLRKKI